MKALYELRSKRAEALTDAQALLENRDFEGFNNRMAEVESMNTEMTAMENLIAEQGRFTEDDTQMIDRYNAQQKQKEEEQLTSTLNQARSGNTYANEFASALRMNANPENLGGEFGALRNALTISGGAGEEGGFLVPIDFDDMIHLKMKEFVQLADLFHVEEVTTSSGWRAIETTASRTPLDKLSELGTIPKSDGPRFQKVEYTIATFGDRIPVSSELLSDNTARLLEYLANWFGPRVVLTENTLLLALLAVLPGKLLTAGQEIAQLKSVLNKGLNTAHSNMAKILTNQSAYDVLDQSVDTNGRGLLVPNPADPDVYRFKQRQVIRADDDLIPNGAGGELPIYVGDFASFGSLFRRQAFEFASTKVGGDAWATNSTEVRGITRMDAQTMDKAAAKLLQIAPGTDSFANPAMAQTATLVSPPLEERFTIEELTALAQLLQPAVAPTEDTGEKDEKDTKTKK